MSKPVTLRFFAELNDFLPAHKRHSAFGCDIKKTRSVKDLIESLGIPHIEVDLIIVNQQSVDFSHQIEGGEQIRIYPANCQPAITPLLHNQPPPLANPRFVLDVHLGQLANYLRMLGFDTLYRNDYDDPTLAEISASEQRILLSCDIKLLTRKQVVYGYFVRSRKPSQQILEVSRHYRLNRYPQTLDRCINCNGIIHAVNKQDILDQLLPLTRKHYDEFFQCDSCHKIYWEGSHYQKIQSQIEKFKNSTH